MTQKKPYRTESEIAKKLSDSIKLEKTKQRRLEQEIQNMVNTLQPGIGKTSMEKGKVKYQKDFHTEYETAFKILNEMEKGNEVAKKIDSLKATPDTYRELKKQVTDLKSQLKVSESLERDARQRVKKLREANEAQQEYIKTLENKLSGKWTHLLRSEEQFKKEQNPR